MIKRCSWIVVILLLLGVVIGAILQIFYQWKAGIVIFLIDVAPASIACILSVIIRIVSGKRMRKMMERKEYDKVLSLSNKLQKWFSGGKNDSAFHANYAGVYFMKGDDVAFQDESEQIVDSRFLYIKYFYRAMYYVLYHNETLARENYNLYLSTSYAAKHPNKANELEFLLKVLSCDGQEKNEAADAALAVVKNGRMRNFLLAEKGSEQSAY